MRTLTKYLLKDTLKPAAVTLCTLLGIIWLMQSLRFLDLIINKGLDAATFFQLTAYLIPSLLIVILPIAVFVGQTLSYKRLLDENEMVALMAIGSTKGRMVKPAIISAFITVGLCYSLTLYFFPAGMTAFKQLQTDLRNEKGTMLLETGTFNQLGDDIMVYLKDRVGTTSFKGLLVHDTRQQSRPVTWMAESGSITTSKEGHPQLKLIEGTRHEVEETKANILSFQEHTLDVLQGIGKKEEHWRDAEERYIPELITPDRQLSQAQTGQFAAEIQKRLLWPLMSIPLALIAAATMVRRPRRDLSSMALTSRSLIYGFIYVAITLVLHNLARDGETAVLYGQWAWPLIATTLAILQINTSRKN